MVIDRTLFTSIWLSKKTHAELENICQKGETFEQLLCKLIKVYKKYGNVYKKENKNVETQS